MAPQRTASNTKMMFCGKHVRPRNVPHSPCKTWDGVKKAERYERRLRDGEKRGSCICDYNDYTVLRKEREDAVETAKGIKKPFPPLKLPAEIRNKVYENLFVLDEAIEFCPEPFFFGGCFIQDREDWHKYYRSNVTPLYEQRLKQKLGPVAPLLRANKQVAKEATPILYGRNEFRFSNTVGWHALDHFLFNIKLAKCAMLRNITVCHPDLVQLPLTNRGEYDFWDGIVRHGGSLVSDAPGHDYGKRWFEDKTVTKVPVAVLEKLGKLENLRMVIPVGMSVVDTYEHEPETARLRSIVNVGKFGNLKVVVVKLLSEQKYKSGRSDDDSGPDMAGHIAKNRLQDTGEEWQHETITIDRFGDYPLMSALQTEGDDEKVPGDHITKAKQPDEQKEAKRIGQDGGETGENENQGDEETSEQGE